MIKKKDFNGQLKSIIKDTISKNDNIQPKKLPKKEIPNKLKVNLSSSLKYISKKKNSKKITNTYNNIYPKIIQKNLQKYNSNSDIKNIMIINNLINCKPCHFLAVFKDYLISDYIEEFLRRIYLLNESIQRLPKLYNYYKNYLLFFCKPTFIDTFSNDIIKNYGDYNAEYFYKNNLEKKKNHKMEKRILDKKFICKNNKDDANEELIRTVFTKSIKNSIDNINEEDSITNDNKLKLDNNIFINDFTNKIQRESLNTLNTDWGVDNNNLISEENSLLIMINEINDIKIKQKITEKEIKISKNISSSNNKKDNNIYSNKYIPKELSVKTINKDTNNNSNNNFINKENNNNNKCNIIKSNTYTNNQHFESLQNMVYSPKSKKNIGFSIKKDKDKDKDNKNKREEKYLSPRIKTINANTNTTNTTNTTGKNNKNHNSIVVNINININTNQNNNNINNNINNNNIKSPIHNINQKRFPLSPLSPINLNISNDKNNPKKDIPLSSSRNNEKENNQKKDEISNYIKIIKKKADYTNLLLSNKRNKKIVQINKIKTINSIESNEYGNKQNYSCNKEMVLYNKENGLNNLKQIQNNEYSINKGNKKLNKKNMNNVYFSPKKLGFKQRYNNSMKELEKIDLNNKNYVYHKKPNNTINSPFNSKIEKKYFSYKKLDIEGN